MATDRIGEASGSGLETDYRVALPGRKGSLKPQELAKYAQEFEASLLSAWMKDMQRSFAWGDKQSADLESLSDMGSQTLALGIAARGGIGIAKMVVQAMSPGEDAGEARASPGKE